ncbi:hypothetical protein JQC92_06255 [Shewanella sp. 202IG2-18]|uniref:hypothetical protein n=1 Tax=Parashewanella hymeniacidonis TaxID=2807618 RepID=UPI0019618193|nr:hypothetical protein [Parashewanella hymeniacidonis]MBM7071642.1 hypothetical protein [Parashewanella hymeniacidonis]
MKKHLKRVCKKQANKAVFQLDISNKKKAKKQARRLAKKTYKSLKKELVQNPKKKIKNQVKIELKNLIGHSISQNDAIYGLKATASKVKLIPTISLTQPLKSKPCSGCPALKQGLCKCAEKAQQRKIAV